MKQKAEPVVSSFKGKSKLIHLLLPKIIAAAILLVLIIGTVVAISIHRENEPRTGVCTTSMINNSLADITSNNMSSLANNVNVIKGLADYKHDPNCMYIVTFYYIDTLNTSHAQSSLKLFNSAYNGHNLSSTLSKYADAKALSLFVTNLTTHAQQLQKNFNNLQGHGLNRSANK